MIRLLLGLYQLIMYAIRFYEIAMIVYFLLSWIPNARQSTLWDILVRLCEPYVGFFRQFIPAIGGVSFAGILALFTLGVIRYGVGVIFNFLIQIFA